MKDSNSGPHLCMPLSLPTQPTNVINFPLIVIKAPAPTIYTLRSIRFGSFSCKLFSSRKVLPHCPVIQSHSRSPVTALSFQILRRFPAAVFPAKLWSFAVTLLLLGVPARSRSAFHRPLCIWRPPTCVMTTYKILYGRVGRDSDIDMTLSSIPSFSLAGWADTNGVGTVHILH